MISDKEYWLLKEGERNKIDRDEAAISEKEVVRYYFWQYARTHGWRQLETMEGYKTKEELLKRCKFYIEKENYPYRITKSTIVEGR